MYVLPLVLPRWAGKANIGVHDLLLNRSMPSLYKMPQNGLLLCLALALDLV